MAEFKNKKKKAQAEEDGKYRGVLDQRRKETMLAYLIRNASAYDQVQERVLVKHVREGIGPAHAVVWKAVRALRKALAELPGRDQIIDQVQQYIADNPDQLDEEAIQQAEAFVTWAFDTAQHDDDLSESEVVRRYAVSLTIQFLEEQAQQKYQEDVVRDGKMPVDLPLMLREHQNDIETIRALGSEVDDAPVFSEGWDTEPRVILRTTGLSFLDCFMDGEKGGETHIIMGPLGSCKTTLAVQKVVVDCRLACAAWATAKAKDEHALKPVVFFVSTEVPKGEFRERVLQNCAVIPRDRLAQMPSLDSLSKSLKTIHDYEKVEFRDMIAAKKFQPEFVRATIATTLINEHLVFMELLDNDDGPSPAALGPQAIVSRIDAWTRKHPGCYVYSVVFDHLSAMARKMAANDPDKMRHHVNRIPQVLQERVAVPYDCPVYILHQLSGAANAKARSPTADIDYTDSAEGKMAAEFCYYALTVNRPNAEQVCVLRCSKHRRSAPQPPRMLRVDGTFSRIIDVNDKFRLDTTRHQIVLTDVAEVTSKSMKKRGRAAVVGYQEDVP